MWIYLESMVYSKLLVQTQSAKNTLNNKYNITILKYFSMDDESLIPIRHYCISTFSMQNVGSENEHLIDIRQCPNPVCSAALYSVITYYYVIILHSTLISVL